MAEQDALEKKVNEIEKKLNEQGELLKAVYKQTNKTRKYILWGRVMSVLYFILIVAPIVIAVIYLPPYISDLMGMFREATQLSPMGQPGGGVDINELRNIIDSYQQSGY